ncbi:hypothetical protein ACWEOE_28985 [Amycolatopsis sp. NPDC004368]
MTAPTAHEPPAYRTPVPTSGGHTETMFPDAKMRGAFVGVIEHDDLVGIHTRYTEGSPHAVILLSQDDARLLAAEILRRAGDREA